jgi:hypothetical protein
MNTSHVGRRRCRAIARCWAFAVFAALSLVAIVVARVENPKIALAGG